MDPSRLISMVHAGAGGEMVWGIVQRTHPLLSASSSITHLFTKLRSSRIGVLNMTMSALYSNGLCQEKASEDTAVTFPQQAEVRTTPSMFAKGNSPEPD